MNAFAAVIGTSTVIRHVQHLVMKVAEVDTSVLITGEVGTGKELVARAVHEKSSRAAAPFVPVRCACAEDLIEVELFGVASQQSQPARVGAFQMAQGGTLFLDEVSRLSPRMQNMLVQALLEGTVTPVGGDTPVQVTARVMCASSRDLDILMRDGAFRDDLYYRIATNALYVPPLRERREDIPHLVNFFVDKVNREKGRNVFGVTSDAMSAFMQYEWRFNIRELENLIERIVALKGVGQIDVCDLPPRLRMYITDNIDSFFEKASLTSRREEARTQRPDQPTRQNAPYRNGQTQQNQPAASPPSAPEPVAAQRTAPPPNNSNFSQSPQGNGQPFNQANQARQGGYEEGHSEIDNFIRKDIDLGNGIDFYRVVEEFENKLIAEALRRTSHNKNRAAQLLSMNRTTLVEKLKKRQNAHLVRADSNRVKRNTAYTIIDGLGTSDAPMSYDAMSFMTREDTHNFPDDT